MTSKAWIEHAYPLQQITVKVQGTRHSERVALIGQLERVIARLRAGDDHGSEHDDDFGYHFAVVASANGPSFFDTPAAAS